MHAFAAAISVILVSEIGDKTFFIAAIMAMRHARLTVFAGAITALILMTILSGKAFYLLTYTFVKSSCFLLHILSIVVLLSVTEKAIDDKV